MTLVTNGRLITRDSEDKGYYEHGAVAYEGTKIVELGEEAALRAKYADAHIIDAKGGVIMPAFINAHTHIYSALARGLSIVGNNPTNFYEVLDGTWWAIDRHLMMDGTRASATALYIDSSSPSARRAAVWVCAPVCATRSPTATARKNASRLLKKMLILSPTAKNRMIPCWLLCSAATRCSPSATRPSTAWWKPTTAVPATTSMSPRA